MTISAIAENTVLDILRPTILWMQIPNQIGVLSFPFAVRAGGHSFFHELD